MPGDYTLEQAELDIAQLRGQMGVLSEILALSSGPVPNAPGSGSWSLYADSNGDPAAIFGSGLAGNLGVSVTDKTNRTVTQAATTQLGAQFTIPANDAKVNTVYEYDAWGFGTWGSTAQELFFDPTFAGSNLGSQGLASSTFAVSTAFNWRFNLRLIVTATGTSGNFDMAAIYPVGANVASSQAGYVSVRTPTVNAFNTTVSNTLQLNAHWNSATGAPTLTCIGSIFTRKGA